MHMDFGGAQTEVSKQGHSLHNISHMRIYLVCAPTGMSTQVHTVHSLLYTDMEVKCEQKLCFL